MILNLLLSSSNDMHMTVKDLWFYRSILSLTVYATGWPCFIATLLYNYTKMETKGCNFRQNSQPWSMHGCFAYIRSKPTGSLHAKGVLLEASVLCVHEVLFYVCSLQCMHEGSFTKRMGAVCIHDWARGPWESARVPFCCNVHVHEPCYEMSK